MSSENPGDFRLKKKYTGKDLKYIAPHIYRALKLSGDYKTSMFDDNMDCTCDCVIQWGCDWEKCTDKSGCPGDCGTHCSCDIQCSCDNDTGVCACLFD